jgi:protein DGCR14
MSSSNSSALTKRPDLGGLMAPPPAPKRIKRPAIVLDEDTYTSAVAHIIRRDFFPGLAETDAQREYLNALESKDNSWIREAGKKLTDVMTPLPAGKRRRVEKTKGGLVAGGKTPLGKGGETPSTWGGDTPRTVAETEVEEEEEEKKPEVDLSLSLNAFQAKYTSEDQESFNKILDKHNAKVFAKNEWLRQGNRYASKQRLAQQKVLEARAASSSSQALTVRPSQDLDERPAGPQGHKHTAFNALMFNPDSVEGWAQTRAQSSETASLAPPKTTLYHNTRLPPPPDPSEKRPPSPTMSAVRDAIAGRPRLSKSEIGYEGSETPRVNGYAFVDAVGPDPGDEEEAPIDLLERYGAKADPNPFTIHDPQRREQLHHKMVERIGSKKSEDNNKAGSKLGILGNNTPRFLSAPTPRAGLGGATPGRKNVGNLTPAAQRLFEKVGGGTPKVRSGGFGQASKESGSGLGREWTPTPKVRRKM